MPIAQLLERTPAEQPAREPANAFARPLSVVPAQLPAGPYLDVRSVTRGLASLYERLRNTLDFRDEHLIRVFAIRRILKRRLTRGIRADRVTVPLLQELIRSGYIPMTAVPERDVPLYERVIEKYIQLFYYLAERYGGAGEHETWDLVFTIAANELEERLAPAPQRRALAAALIAQLERERVLVQWPLTPGEAHRLAVIAAHRGLLKANAEIITWQLFLARYPDWMQEPALDRVQSIADDLEAARREWSASLHHPASDRLTRHIKPVATTLWLLQESLAAEPDAPFVLAHPRLLAEKLQGTIERYYKSTSKRLRRILWRSLLYIFLTKMAIALLIEIPFDRIVQGHINLFTIGFNVVVPPLLLLIFGLSVQLPGKKNTVLLQTLAERLVYEGEARLDPLRRPASQRALLATLFNVFYGIIYLVSFGAVVTMLLRFRFNFVGIAIFLFFLSVVSFFGFRMREQAQDLIVTKGEDRFLVFLAVLFFLPILRTGRWISQQSSKINIFLYFFDLFIEAPLQAFLEFFDKFTGFVREKKDDVVS